MSMPFDIHKYLRAARVKGRGDATAKPYQNKEYPRMPTIDLPPPERIDLPLGDALALRSSGKKRGSVTIGSLSTILNTALAARPDGKRPYPSGGALFPIETYIIADKIEGLPRAALHFHPKKHVLEYLWDMPDDFSARDVYKKAESASGFVVLTAVWARSARKYRDFAYYLGMLEAGHAAQNLLLCASALDISACPVGGFTDIVVSNLLDLNEATEQPIYVIQI